MRTLVLFTRSPEAEARAKGLPAKAGARLFRELLSSWCRAARGAGVRLSMMAPASSVRALASAFAGEGVSVKAQRGGTFARRLEDAMARAFAGGGTPVLLVGGDSPPPSAAALAHAFDQLEQRGDRVVLGPSPDGGVNVIGLLRPLPELLEGVPWTSPAVDRCLRERASALGLTVTVLPAVLDVDRAADVLRAHELSSAVPAWRLLRHVLAALLPDRGPRLPASVALPQPPCAGALPARGPPPPPAFCF